MKHTKGGWLLESGDKLQLRPGVQKTISDLLIGGLKKLHAEGKLKITDGKIDWSSLPPPPPRRKPKKGDFRITGMFIPDLPASADNPKPIIPARPSPPSVTPAMATSATPRPPAPAIPEPNTMTDAARSNQEPLRGAKYYTSAMICDLCGSALKLLHSDGKRWAGVCSTPSCATMHRGSFTS